jgi:cytosine/adenosine deaminase-related metal-dependent hydrolase
MEDNNMTINKDQKRLQALAAAAANDADALGLFYGEIFEARLTANIQAIRSAATNKLVTSHTDLNNAIVQQVVGAYVDDNVVEAVEIMIPKPLRAGSATKSAAVNVESLMPRAKPVQKLKAGV